MIETEFKKELAKAQRSYFTTNITDDEIFQLNMEILSGIVDTILRDYDASMLVKVLSYYLINSTDTYDVKEKISDQIRKFVEFATKANRNRTELLVLDEALTAFEDK